MSSFIYFLYQLLPYWKGGKKRKSSIVAWVSQSVKVKILHIFCVSIPKLLIITSSGLHFAFRIFSSYEREKSRENGFLSFFSEKCLFLCMREENTKRKPEIEKDLKQEKVFDILKSEFLRSIFWYLVMETACIACNWEKSKENLISSNKYS